MKGKTNMNISIDYEQGKFIRDTAAARIKSARMTLTPEYRREHLGWMADSHYEQNCIDRENEIAMLRELLDHLCEYCAYKRDGKDNDGPCLVQMHRTRRTRAERGCALRWLY